VIDGSDPYDVFISYSARDRADVRTIAESLRRDGFRVWFDQWSLPPGGNVQREIVDGVQRSNTLVQCLSRHGLGSEWAATEREILLIDDPGNTRGRYIPLLLADVDLPPDLRRFRYVDYRSDRSRAYAELSAHLSEKKQRAGARLKANEPPRRTTAAVFRGGATPLRPPRLFGRERDFDTLCRFLVATDEGNGAIAAIHGWPGVGKTALAAAVAHVPQIREAFPDGILWATVGDNPDCDEILRLWSVGRGIDATGDAAAREIRLREHLSDKRVLVVLDDVWVSRTSQLFVAGTQGRTLLTTRAPAIARLFVSSHAHVHRLDCLSSDDARALLADAAPAPVERSPDASRDLCARLENLPLAIKVAGRLLQARFEVDGSLELTKLFVELSDRQQLLEEAPPGDIPFPAASMSPTVAALFVTSIEHLAGAMRKRFLDLAVLAPAPALFSRDHASIAMVVRGNELTQTLTAFYNGGLIEPLSDGQYWIHSMLVATAAWMRR